MDGHRAGLLLTVGVVLLAASGASCPRVVPPQGNLFSQAVLPPSPSLEQIIAAVNNNSQQIQTFSTNRATINGAGFPALRASVFFERPRRFRLRAETALTGPELDLGSNDELFWIWVRRNQPQALYYCRHDQYPTSQARQALGIDPDWLVEAVGITQFDPSLPHQGPFPRPNNRYEIRTIRETANGPTTKITIIDGSQALVLEQHLLDSQGQLVASAITSEHRVDPLTLLVLPRIVDIRWPKSQLSLRIDLGAVEINRQPSYSPELWLLPTYDGWPPVDLCNPNFQFAPTGAPRAAHRGRRALQW
jgi:hypothetical protein